MVGWGEKKRKEKRRLETGVKPKQRMKCGKKKNEVFGAFPKLLS